MTGTNRKATEVRVSEGVVSEHKQDLLGAEAMKSGVLLFVHAILLAQRVHHSSEHTPAQKQLSQKDCLRVCCHW